MSIWWVAAALMGRTGLRTFAGSGGVTTKCLFVEVACLPQEGRAVCGVDVEL